MSSALSTPNSCIISGSKQKIAKHTKTQLIQQRATQNVQQQFQQQQNHQHNSLYNNNNQYAEIGSQNVSISNQNISYHCNNEITPSLILNPNQTYKFNSSYHSNAHLDANSQMQQNNNSNMSTDSRLNYYNQPIKSELIDEPNLYDSKQKFIISNNSEYGSVTSSSSSSSTSSASSLSSIPPEAAISINISNSAYHYGNYFNGLNQPYAYTNCVNENGTKFYGTSSSSSSTSPFYSSQNTNTNTVLPNSSTHNPGYNFYTHHLNQHFNENNNDGNNLHSNSSCSSTTSNSSSSSSSSSICSSGKSNSGNLIPGNLGNESINEYSSNMGLAAVAAGVLWPKPDSSEVLIASSRLTLPTSLHNEQETHQNYHHINHSSYSSVDLSSASSQFIVNNQMNGGITAANHYSDLFNCANNAANIAAAAAKYSCAASVTSSSLNNGYCQYPFAVDDYNSSVSQI